MPRVYRALNKVSYSHTPSGNMTHVLNMFLVCIIQWYVGLIWLRYSLLKLAAISVLFLRLWTSELYFLWHYRCKYAGCSTWVEIRGKTPSLIFSWSWFTHDIVNSQPSCHCIVCLLALFFLCSVFLAEIIEQAGWSFSGISQELSNRMAWQDPAL